MNMYLLKGDYNGQTYGLFPQVEIKDPKLVTMKNGRIAVSGFAAEDPR